MILTDFFVEQGYGVEAKDNYEETPLYKASGNGHFNVVNIDSSIYTRLGSTTLIIASEKRHLSIVKS